MRHRTAPFNRRAERSSRVTARDPTPQSMAPRPRLHFKINRITLEGFSAADQSRFTHSLRSNLTELMQSYRDHSWFEAEELRPSNIGLLGAGASPEDAARQAATIIAKLTRRQIAQQREGGKKHA